MFNSGVPIAQLLSAGPGRASSGHGRPGASVTWVKSHESASKYSVRARDDRGGSCRGRWPGGRRRAALTSRRSTRRASCAVSSMTARRQSAARHHSRPSGQPAALETEPDRPWRPDPCGARLDRCADGVRSRRRSRGARRQGLRAVGVDRRRSSARTGCSAACWAASGWRRASRSAQWSSVVGIVLPNGADTQGPAVPPAVLRETLGVNNSTWTGRGVGVAVIDSGLEMSSEFHGPRDGVLRLHERRHRRDVSVRRLRARHARRRHDRRIGRAVVERDYRGLAPNVKFVVLKVLDKNGAGYTSDVIRADRLRGGQPGERSASTSSTCRSAIRSTSRRRPIRWCRRLSARPRAGIDRRRRRRQLRHEPDDRPARLCGHHVARQRAVGDHGWRGQDARHRRAQRRSHSGLQLGRPDLVRRLRQAGRRRARPQHRRRGRQAGHALQDVSAAEGRRRRLHAPERHEHGDGRDAAARSR